MKSRQVRETSSACGNVKTPIYEPGLSEDESW